MKNFVLSQSKFEFETVKEAEDQVEKWLKQDNLKLNTRLYKVTEVYEMKLKFVNIK